MKQRLAPPSPLFTAHVDALRAAARLGPVVDLASGRGRHALAAAAAGLPTVALDRNAEFLAELGAAATREGVQVRRVQSDLEAADGLPFGTNSCGAVLVFRFLFRPLCEEIARILAPGGVLLYETFTVAQREIGTGPKNARFLLKEGELPDLFPSLAVASYEEGSWSEPGHPGGPPTSATARLAARKRA